MNSQPIVSDRRAIVQRDAFLARLAHDFDNAVAFNAACIAKKIAAEEVEREKDHHLREWKRANDLDTENRRFRSLLQRVLGGEIVDDEIRVALC